MTSPDGLLPGVPCQAPFLGQACTRRHAAACPRNQAAADPAPVRARVRNIFTRHRTTSSAWPTRPGGWATSPRPRPCPARGAAGTDRPSASSRTRDSRADRRNPAWPGPDMEIAVAAAGFEYWPGMQDQVMADCAAAPRRPGPGAAAVGAGLPGRARVLAGAAVTIISTTSPESRCNAAEALSAVTRSSATTSATSRRDGPGRSKASARS